MCRSVTPCERAQGYSGARGDSSPSDWRSRVFADTRPERHADEGPRAMTSAVTLLAALRFLVGDLFRPLSHSTSCRDVTTAPLRVGGGQILAFRRRVGALDQRLPAGRASLRRAAWAGLQDSMPRAALLSIHARVEGAGPAAWEDPSLVQVWDRATTCTSSPRATSPSSRSAGFRTAGRSVEGRTTSLSASTSSSTEVGCATTTRGRRSE